MKFIDKKYLFVIFAHIIIGFLIFTFPVTSKIYAFSVLIIGLCFIIKNKNANNEVLLASAYIVGCEVFLRTTHGNPNHEFAKYCIILFALLGICYGGIFKKSWPFWVFLCLLIPGIIVGANALEAPITKKIVFDISGPVSLGVCSIYTYKSKITINAINAILLAISLPLIACCAFLFLDSPSLDAVHFNTESSFILSGNYGPNQLSTVLGLGLVVFFLRLILKQPTTFHFTIDLLLMMYIFYRGILTFSRGGIFAAVLTICVVFIFAYWNADWQFRKQLLGKTVIIFIALSAIFVWTSNQSHGVLKHRYANEDKNGKARIHKATGRLKVALREINFFEEHPVLGIGIGKGKEIRNKELGKRLSSHSEMTRMLAEHGLPGILALLLLIAVPVILFFNDKRNIYLVTFFVFWFLTINHAGMRVAAPSFIYALALINIQSVRKLFTLKQDPDSAQNS